MLVEKLRVGAQEARDVVCVHFYSSMVPSNTVAAGPFIDTGLSPPAQAMVNVPPRVSHPHRRIEQAARDAGHHRGAGAGAARQRLARAALPDAQRNAVAVEHLHVAGVHPLRKARVRFEQRALRRDRRARHVGHQLHRVRIAHRQDGGLDLPALHVELFGHRTARACPCRRVTSPSASRRGRIVPPSVSHLDLRLPGQPAGMHELHEAARAVAALLHLAAVGVEDAVAEVAPRRRSAARPPGPGRSQRRDGDRQHASTGLELRVKASRVQSRTTKSLPAPCILVNASFTPPCVRRPRYGRSTPRRAADGSAATERSCEAFSETGRRNPLGNARVGRLLVQRHGIEHRAGDAFLAQRLADRVAPLAADGELVVHVRAAPVLDRQRHVGAGQLLAIAPGHARGAPR